MDLSDDLTDDDRPQAMEVHNDSSIYLTGTPGSLRLDADGNLLWSRTDHDGYDLSVDAEGNCYVVGGKHLGFYRHDGPANDLDVVSDIKLNKGVYITGESYGINTQSDFMTVKISFLFSSEK